MRKIATKVKVTDDNLNQHAAVYFLSVPWAGHSFVWVSKIRNMFAEETYVFASTPEGEVTDWMELGGSRRGDYTHAEVLGGMGYTISE